MDTHGGDRQVDWEKRQDRDRLSAPRLRPLWPFNKIVGTEIEAGGADNVTTGENSSYGRLRVRDVTSRHRKWKISVCVLMMKMKVHMIFIFVISASCFV